MENIKFSKIIFFSAGIILVVLFSAFLVNKNLNNPKFIPPNMEFVKEKIDFGKIPQGPMVEGEFEFTNTGRSMLEIKKITPACGCTGLIADEKKEYQPGESGKIKFTFNTEGRSGHNEKTITIETNIPDNPTKIVSFSADIFTQ